MFMHAKTQTTCGEKTNLFGCRVQRWTENHYIFRFGFVFHGIDCCGVWGENAGSRYLGDGYTKDLNESWHIAHIDETEYIYFILE